MVTEGMTGMLVISIVVTYDEAMIREAIDNRQL